MIEYLLSAFIGFVIGYTVARLVYESVAGTETRVSRVTSHPVIKPPVLPNGATDDQWDAWDEAMGDWRDRLVDDLQPCEKCGSTAIDLRTVENGILCVDCGWTYSSDEEGEDNPLYALAVRWNTRCTVEVIRHHGP